MVPISDKVYGHERTINKLNEEEIQIAHQQMLELAKSGREDEIDDLYLVKKYRELFQQDNELLKQYLDNVDILNSKKMNKSIGKTPVRVDLNTNNDVIFERDIIVMDDGSFLISEFVDAPSIEPSNRIGLYTAITNPYGTRITTHTHTIVHLAFPNTQLKLKTTYDLTRSGIEIAATTTAGTTALFPVMINRSAKINKAKATSTGDIATAQGDYKVNYLGTHGVAIYSEDFTILTRYRLSAINVRAGSVSYNLIKIVQR